MGLYAYALLEQAQVEKQLQQKAAMEARAAFINYKTNVCNNLGFLSYDIDKNVCYTAQNTNYNKQYRSNYYEELALE
jgi:hypothetical protein